MKQKYLILLMLLLHIVFISCNNQPSGSVRPSTSNDPVKKKGLGKIELTKEMHNFGALKEGEIVSYSFQFKNNGTAPFRLSRVEPGCGCLTVKFDPEEIAPQATSFIEVIFHSDGEWGNQVKSVSIETSYGETKTITIGAYVENKNFNMDLNNLK
ncbi:MAG: DUF1573 domain-containing protein [Prolixibacteraceae bacterium]